MSTIDDTLARVPGPDQPNIAVRVKPAAERAVRQGHPWVFDGAIRDLSRSGKPGDLAVLFDERKRFLAVGLYDPLSAIRVRVLQSGKPTTVDARFFRASLDAALRIRRPLQHSNTTAYRLVNGENDGFPGLVIDRYEDTLVLELYTAAWLPHLRPLLEALAEAWRAQRWVLRLGRNLEQHPDVLYGLSDGQILMGPPLEGPIIFRENGLRFEADPVHGQKTGFFLDQRDNRARVETLSSGRRVLNCFAYTGGFSVYAGRGGAESIVSLDISAPALQAAERNWQLNRDRPGIAAAKHSTLLGDAFELLPELRRRGQTFDMVIIDPPSFAQNQAQVAGAIAAYQRLTRLGLAVLDPLGTLVQSSCSSPVSAETFFTAVEAAAAQVNRRLRDITRTGHALDHPVTFPEGAYLKCLFATAQ